MLFVLPASVLTVMFFGIAFFERVAPRGLVRLYWRIVNPIFRLGAGRMPGLVLLETKGRRTGQPHRVPVAGRPENDRIWFVAGHGSQSSYLRNIKADPKVRVRVGGGWRTGKACVLVDDDASRRAVWVNPINGLFVRLATPDLVTVRVDLDRQPAS